MDISSQINLENIPRGIYNFRIEMDRQVVVEKLLRL